MDLHRRAFAFLRALEYYLFKDVLEPVEHAHADRGQHEGRADAAQAAAAGASFIVVGRPILKAKDPAAETLRIRRDIGETA